MVDDSLAALDRDVASAFDAWRRWRDRLRDDPQSAKENDPLAEWRHVAGLRTYEALRSRAPGPVDVPWHDAICRWVLALTQHRVTRDLDVAWELARGEASAGQPDVGRLVSWRESWGGVLTARDRGAALAWLGAAATRAPVLASIATERAARRAEVARRMGLAHPFVGATTVEPAQLLDAARRILVRTEDLARAMRREAARQLEVTALEPVDVMRLALAQDAPEGWPARLTTSWLEKVFPGLAKGLRLNVRLPRPLGAASFARALDVFGHGVRAAAASLPFALAREPYFVDADRFGLAFASLVTSREFYRRALGISIRKAAAQARVLAHAALFEARAIATRAILAGGPAPPSAGVFEEMTAVLFGVPLPRAFAGAWPPPRDDEPARLGALLTTDPFVRELVERFDVDWFANPRATLFLRARASAPARDAGGPFDSERAVLELAERLEEALA
jgi:hypothetical protein